MTASLKINHLRFLYPLNCESLASSPSTVCRLPSTFSHLPPATYHLPKQLLQPGQAGAQLFKLLGELVDLLTLRFDYPVLLLT